MRTHSFFLPALACAASLLAQDVPKPQPTREFEVRAERAHLGGKPVELWGLRCGNALHSWTVTERHVRALDTMAAHGINLIGVYVQGSHGGWPDPDAGLNGFRRNGALKKDVAARLEWLVREADARGMVVMVGLFSPRKDQELEGEPAVQRAIAETGALLVERGLRNVFVDIVHEFDHTERADLDIFREPDGAAKKARLGAWWQAAAPGIEFGACPYEKSSTTDTFEGMQVRIIQKSMAIPASGFVVNVESQKQDSYENDGVFGAGHKDAVYADCEAYLAAPHAVMLFHAGYVQGIGNFSGSGPHPEPGGMGDTAGDRGVRFYFEWVRDRVGSWQYPSHVPYAAPSPAAPQATREFAVRDNRALLGGVPVKLWGLRTSNVLVDVATTQRLVNNLDNLAAHGINCFSVALQGTNGGFPDVDAGPSAFTPDGRLIPSFARRTELLVREADKRGMVVLLTLMMPRKDQHLRDEAAVRNAIENTARFLVDRKLRNVMVNLYQEFHHPTRIDHEIFREPDGDAKKQRITAWWRAIAPDIEVGICPNHLNGSPPDYTGADIVMIHEEMPVPKDRYVVNTETPDEDMSGNEGVFNAFQRARMEKIWAAYVDDPHTGSLFRAPYVEDVRGAQGTGPNFEMGGNGMGMGDRGIRFFFEWSRQRLGAWVYPEHRR